MRRKVSTMLAVLLASALTISGCAKKEAAPAAEPAPAEQEAEPAETADPEEAEQPGGSTSKQIENAAILVVSFGTSYNDNRRLTIGAVEESMEAAFPDWSVRRAFTAIIWR